MKLLVLSYEYPPIGGGGGIICKHLSEELTILGHNITIITTWVKNLKNYEEPKKNITIYRLNSRRKKIYASNPIEMLSWAYHTKSFLKKHLKTNQYDLCIAHFTIPGGIVAHSIYKKFNLKYVIISHGHDIPWVKPKILYFYHALLYFKTKAICKKSELNFVQSNEMKINIDKFISPSSKNIKIPNGYNDNMFFYKQKIKSTNEISILFSGRLVKQKDPITFIKSLNILQLKYQISFNATIVGNGYLKNKILRLIKKYKLTKKVKLIGKINYAQMPEIYQSADILVQPSVSEGMSIAIIEAIACGLFVITTPASGNKELINNDKIGKIIPPKNPIIIATEIKNHTQNTEIQKYNQNNIISKNWEHIAKIYNKYFLTIQKPKS